MLETLSSPENPTLTPDRPALWLGIPLPASPLPPAPTLWALWAPIGAIPQQSAVKSSCKRSFQFIFAIPGNTLEMKYCSYLRPRSGKKDQTKSMWLEAPWRGFHPFSLPRLSLGAPRPTAGVKAHQRASGLAFDGKIK